MAHMAGAMKRNLDFRGIPIRLVQTIGVDDRRKLRNMTVLSALQKFLYTIFRKNGF